MTTLLVKQVLLLLLCHLQTLLDLRDHVNLVTFVFILKVLSVFSLGKNLCVHCVSGGVQLCLNVTPCRLISIEQDPLAELIVRIQRLY